ncbi:MAG: hypothetical protein JO323_19590 [Acidobacteriia bacterium]|nr:hypothetical protein [Terriglobia bacterium]
MPSILSLDDDVAELLSAEARRTKVSFQEAGNQFLRLGLTAASQRQRHRRFIVTPRALGLPPGLSYDDIQRLLEGLETRRK